VKELLKIPPESKCLWLSNRAFLSKVQAITNRSLRGKWVVFRGISSRELLRNSADKISPCCCGGMSLTFLRLRKQVVKLWAHIFFANFCKQHCYDPYCRSVWKNTISESHPTKRSVNIFCMRSYTSKDAGAVNDPTKLNYSPRIQFYKHSALVELAVSNHSSYGQFD